MEWPVDEIRANFHGLKRTQDGCQVALFDGPAGSQVPECVIDAVSGYLRDTNCNRGAAFATSLESDCILDAAHRTMAAFVGADNSSCVVFGANMTTMTLQVSRALAVTWNPGDEIIVSRLDHDANVTPWVLAAAERGVVVRWIDLTPDDWTLNLADYHDKLSPKTRLVAFGYASNATGTINPVREMVQAAREVGALTYLDAVHFAPHGRLNVEQLGCDFLVCSAYKFFGPHVGILWGREELLTQIRPHKLRPSPDSLPGRWMTGTQNHEGIAGAAAAVRYLAELSRLPGLETQLQSQEVEATCPQAAPGSPDAELSAQLDTVLSRISRYEQTLSRRLLSGLAANPQVRVLGISDANRIAERVPTVSFLVEGKTPRECASLLARRGVYVWCGNHYALPFTEAAGLEPNGTIRVGALHYNTPEEIDRLLQAVSDLS